MTTKATKKTVKKKATKATTTGKPTVTLTVKQALQMQAFMAKNNKSFKVLDTKIATAVNA